MPVIYKYDKEKLVLAFQTVKDKFIKKIYITLLFDNAFAVF